MRDHYGFIFKTNPEVGPSPFFSNDLQPTRAWESPLQAYGNYIQDFYDELFNNVLAPLGDSKDIRNFDDFVKVLLEYVTNERKAFTRMAHGDPKTSILNTGLAIEILMVIMVMIHKLPLLSMTQTTQFMKSYVEIWL